MEAANIFAHIEATIGSGAEPVAGMGVIIDFCQSRAPEADWQRIRALPFEADLLRLDAWLTSVLVTESPPAAIDGLWFGLFEPVRDDGEESMDIYICGSDHYDPDEDWHDWACNPVYWPARRYANSQVLHGIKAAARLKPELPYDLSDYALSLAYSSLFVASFARRNAKLLLNGASSRALV
ncbi:MAG TPA: hypothetical protein VIU93_07245, partial [Gallionellaceae bacterium]